MSWHVVHSACNLSGRVVKQAMPYPCGLVLGLHAHLEGLECRRAFAPAQDRGVRRRRRSHLLENIVLRCGSSIRWHTMLCAGLVMQGYRQVLLVH